MGCLGCLVDSHDHSCGFVSLAVSIAQRESRGPATLGPEDTQEGVPD